MQYDITLTYSMFTFCGRTFSAIKYRIYCIKRPVYVILNVHVYQWLRHPK